MDSVPLNVEPWIFPIIGVLEEQEEKNRVAAEKRQKGKGRHRAN